LFLRAYRKQPLFSETLIFILNQIVFMNYSIQII